MYISIYVTLQCPFVTVSVVDQTLTPETETWIKISV